MLQNRYYDSNKKVNNSCANAGYYSNLDLLKYLASICVIWIHLSVLLTLTNPFWLEMTIRTAVPFFFVASGFLMNIHAATKPDFSDYFRIKGLKMLRLWVVWLLIYLPLDIIWSRHEEFSLMQTLRWIKHAITTGEGTISWPLWFLFSMFIGCFVLSIACRKRAVAGATGIFLTSTLLYVATNIFSSFLFTSLPGIAERVLSGAIYMSAGILISRYQPQHTVSWWLMAGAVLLLTAGCAMTYSGIMLGTLPRSLGVVMLAIYLPQANIPSISIRQQSIWIFYTHMYCLVFLCLMDIQKTPILFIVLSIMISMALGLILTLLTKVRQLSFLRTLIS